MMFDDEADKILVSNHSGYLKTMRECPTCEGTGKEEVEKTNYTPQNYDRFPEPVYVVKMEECSLCRGTGEVQDAEEDGA